MISVEHRWERYNDGWVLHISANDGAMETCKYRSSIHDSKMECMNEFTKSWYIKWSNYDEFRVAILNHIKEKL